MGCCERLSSILLGAAMLACGAPALAESWFGDQGKLLLTAGFSTVEGAGGGGLTPWALITGYGSRDSWGANTYVTGIGLRDFDFSAVGVGIGIRDRVELSFSRQQLEGTDGPREDDRHASVGAGGRAEHSAAGVWEAVLVLHGLLKDDHGLECRESGTAVLRRGVEAPQVQLAGLGTQRFADVVGQFTRVRRQRVLGGTDALAHEPRDEVGHVAQFLRGPRKPGRVRVHRLLPSLTRGRRRRTGLGGSWRPP